MSISPTLKAKLINPELSKALKLKSVKWMLSGSL